MMLPIVIAICFAVLVYSVILIAEASSPREKIRDRIKKLSDDVELEYVHEAVLSEKRKKRKLVKKSRLISRKFEDTLSMSGLKLSAQEYLTIWALLTVGPGIIGSILGLKVVAVLGLCVIGFAVLPIMLKQARSKREQLFNKQLGESLTIMSNCMRSGYSFQQAMGSIAREMQPPISIEFDKVLREMNYGTSMEQALNNMVRRVNNKDLELLVSAVLTSIQVGANLSEILDTIAETVSERIRLREEVRIFSAQGRISGVIIGALPVVVILFLMVINPTYFSDFASTTIGKGLIGLSVFLELTGFLIINKIVDIKY